MVRDGSANAAADALFRLAAGAGLACTVCPAAKTGIAHPALSSPRASFTTLDALRQPHPITARRIVSRMRLSLAAHAYPAAVSVSPAAMRALAAHGSSFRQRRRSAVARRGATRRPRHVTAARSTGAYAGARHHPRRQNPAGGAVDCSGYSPWRHCDCIRPQGRRRPAAPRMGRGAPCRTGKRLLAVPSWLAGDLSPLQRRRALWTHLGSRQPYRRAAPPPSASSRGASSTSSPAPWWRSASARTMPA